jgi:hypothetical protein
MVKWEMQMKDYKRVLNTWNENGNSWNKYEMNFEDFRKDIESKIKLNRWIWITRIPFFTI